MIYVQDDDRKRVEKNIIAANSLPCNDRNLYLEKIYKQAVSLITVTCYFTAFRLVFIQLMLFDILRQYYVTQISCFKSFHLFLSQRSENVEKYKESLFMQRKALEKIVCHHLRMIISKIVITCLSPSKPLHNIFIIQYFYKLFFESLSLIFLSSVTIQVIRIESYYCIRNNN